MRRFNNILLELLSVMGMEEFRCGDLGKTELSPELKLGVGKPLGWTVLIGPLYLFYFMFLTYYLG